MGSLHLEPLIAPALWITLAVASVLMLVSYARRRPTSVRRGRWASIIVLVGLGLGAVLVVLLNPTWVEPIPPPAGKPLVTVLVDRSASMAAPDNDGGGTRYQAAADMAQGILREAADRFEVRVRHFDTAVTPGSVADFRHTRPTGQLTDLAGALTATLADDRPQGQAVVLLSDGIHNAGGGSDAVLEAAQLARAMAAPVYSRTIGGEAGLRDLAVRLRSPQELSFVGQRVPVVARVSHRGPAGGRVTVVLEHDGEEIDRREAHLTTTAPVEVRFEVRKDESGLYRYAVRAQEFPGEVTRVNNRATLLLRVVDEPLRVLLLEGKPYWDSKFLMRTLASDPAVELDSVVKLTEDRLLRRSLRRAATASQPASRREDWTILADAASVLTDRDTLWSYQIVVLGRDAEAFLSEDAMINLRRWVAREGGALLCYRGSPVAQVDQRLASLLPVHWTPASESRFHLQLTPRGQDLNWLAGSEATGDPFSRMPSLATVARVDRAKPLTVVLAKTVSSNAGGEQAAVSYQPYGTGRVIVVEGAGMWRWAFLAPKYQEHDGVYRGLWQSLLRWLASSTGLLPGQDVALRCSKASFSTLETCSAMLLAREEGGVEPGLQVRLTGDALEEARTFLPVPAGDEPGTFRVVFGRLAEGHYHADVVRNGQPNESIGTAFEVHQFLGEQLDLKARPDLMKRIADDSGGAVIEGQEPNEALNRFQQHLAESRLQRVQRTTAWDRWWILLAILMVWGAAWGLRRSGGLI